MHYVITFRKSLNLINVDIPHQVHELEAVTAKQLILPVLIIILLCVAFKFNQELCGIDRSFLFFFRFVFSFVRRTNSGLVTFTYTSRAFAECRHVKTHKIKLQLNYNIIINTPRVCVCISIQYTLYT